MVDYNSREHWATDFEIEIVHNAKSLAQLDEIFKQLAGYATKIKNILSRDNKVAEVQIECSDEKIIFGIFGDTAPKEGQEFYNSEFGKILMEIVDKFNARMEQFDKDGDNITTINLW